MGEPAQDEEPAAGAATSGPAEEYRRRLEVRKGQAAALARQHEHIGNARLLMVVVTLAVAWVALHLHWLSAWWLSVPLAAFAALVTWHYRVQRARSQAERAVSFYRHGLARIEDGWEGEGESGERLDDLQHVYASDLDLFGHGSLFQLLCSARTRMGEETLAQWLLAPATTERIRERHACVSDLRGRIDLREQLAILGEDTGPGVRPQRLATWAQTPNELQRVWIKAAAWVLPLAAIASVTLWAMTSIMGPVLLVLATEIALLRSLRRSVDKVLLGSESAFEDLRLFAAVVTRLEREPLEAPRLRALLEHLGRPVSASAALGSLATIVNFAGSRRNQLFAMLAVPLMYPLLVALAAEHWRELHGQGVGTWIETVGELEALSSLAAYSYEHPADPFPELVEEGPASFEGWQLGHPLLPAARCVRNDVQLTDPVRMLLVSGSNMSGKSTLLRTVGVNTVLAMAGAPVRAARLRLTPLQVGASIRITDSLQEGSSHFYAEITRLRQLLNLAERRPPLLFLLDELLQGTNSSDRLAGAAGILRGFVDRGAIGLVSTHDLALTHIDQLAVGALRNVHFEDEVRDGQIAFDFRLRDGVVTKSNGIELMRLVGLDV